ncbi:MAG: phenylalanine-4-hydroxylase [Bacteroidia bacterium]|nr:phenylalanine-4-hydroxylase [Bacteroidia bacterium]NNJ54890.1 phenylalanine-4-hydroxylase [Bacteroidia bacterium]
MQQSYSKYTEDDHEVWKILYDRQVDNLENKAHPAYLTALEDLFNALHNTKVPNFNEVDKTLLSRTGWSIEVVPGLIPVVEFFELLAIKRFPSSTWLRKKSELDYLEEPDMFHDSFGHLPLLANTDYANFMQKIGLLGIKHKANEDIITKLKSYYWFTIEFGLVKMNEKTGIYGAGLISSYGETNQIYTDKVIVKPFDIEEIINTSFVNSEMQNLYYKVESLNQLYLSIEELERRWS